MTLWTIQSEEFLKTLIDKKEISGDSRYIDEDFKEGYDWMVEQMNKRIGKNPKPERYPIWAWYQYDSANRKKPDLRRSGHLDKGRKGVRLTIQKRSEDVLLSDFIIWHQPLIYKGKITESEKEDIDFRSKLTEFGFADLNFNNYSSDFKREIIESWDKIFDLNFNRDYWTYNKDSKAIQATFWELKLDEVVNVEYFTAK